MRDAPAESGIASPAGDDGTTLRIGGYELPRKYVEDRRRRGLTPSESAHLETIRQTIARTVEIRAMIDEIVRAEPPWAGPYYALRA